MKQNSNNIPYKNVCFYGDSITHDSGFIKEIVQHYLNSNKKTEKYAFYNLGISGDTAAGGVLRLENDLLTYNPDIVIIMFGMNDIGRSYYVKSTYNTEGYEKIRQDHLNNFKNNISKMVGELTNKNIEVILCTPTPYNDVSENTVNANEGLAKCAEFIRELAHKNNIKVIDHFANMYPLRSAEYWNTDAVHPNALGQHIIAQSMMYSLGYINEIDASSKTIDLSPENVKCQKLAYDFRMLIMVERSLMKSGLNTLEKKKARAKKLMDEQTSEHWRWIYRNYLENIDTVLEMKANVINLTESLL